MSEEYQLTKQQMKTLNILVNEVLEVMDEFMCADFLIPDSLLEEDNSDEVNKRKAAAFKYVIDKLK